MLKKFFSGIVFGAGFSIAALCAYTVWFLYVLPPLFDQSFNADVVVEEGVGVNPPQQFEYTPNFHELLLDEKIELASAIIVVRYEEGNGESYRSIVEDVLKKEEGVELYYNVGEVYEENTHHKISDDFVPIRAIVFMQGNPATMRFSTTFDGERVDGLGGISLALLREKCNET